MALARLIHALVAVTALVVAPWLAGWSVPSSPAETAPHASSCCGPDGSCCCGIEDELPPSCPCCPAPAAPKPASPVTAVATSTEVGTATRIARPRVVRQHAPRNLRREAAARADADRCTKTAINSWRPPSANVRLWTGVDQT